MSDQRSDTGGSTFVLFVNKRSIKKSYDIISISATALIHKYNWSEVCQCKLDWHDPLSAFLVLDVKTDNSV